MYASQVANRFACGGSGASTNGRFLLLSSESVMLEGRIVCEIQ